MKKLISIVISLTMFMLLTSCKLVVDPTEMVVKEETAPNNIGVRIRYSDYNQENPDYYYDDGREVNPYISLVKKEEYIDDDGANIQHIEIDLYLSQVSCSLVDVMFLKDNGTVEYSNTHWDCGIASSTSLSFNFKGPDHNETIKYTVNYKRISELLEYKVIQYDENNNKITQLNPILAENKNVDIMIDAKTKFFKVIKTYKSKPRFSDVDFEIIEERELFSIEDIENISEIIYSLDENNERIYYNFNFKTQD